MMPQVRLKIDLDKAQRKFAAKHVMNGGYGALVGLAFSQVLAEQINIFLVILGVIFYVGSWITALKLTKGTI